MRGDPLIVEVDGVPTLFFRSESPSMSAGLIFRVGRADETLATSGLTHLAEHLALHRHGNASPHSNGTTAETFTVFDVEGSADHVVAYFGDLSRGLRDVPVDRLEAEKSILLLEAARRSSGLAEALAAWRYGAAGYGLSNWDELGLHRLRGDEVVEWISENFTTGNAVLWIVAPEIPATVGLALPEGHRRPFPAVTSALPELPAWFELPVHTVALEAIVARSTPARIATRILSQAMFQRLRHVGALSYAADAQYRPRDRDHAAITAIADCPPDGRDLIVREFLNVLERMRKAGTTEHELLTAQEASRHLLNETDPRRIAPAMTLDYLWGREPSSREELLAEIDQTTLEDIQRTTDEIFTTALLQVPPGSTPVEGFSAAPATSATAVDGDPFRAISHRAPTLIIGPGGVTSRFHDQYATVRFDECEAMQAFPDGARRLTGRDGFTVIIEPTLHRIKPAALRLIDASVDPQIVIPMPPRDPQFIPKPEPRGFYRPLTRWQAILTLSGLCLGSAFFLFAFVVSLVNVVMGELDLIAGGLLFGAIGLFLGAGALKTYTFNFKSP